VIIFSRSSLSWVVMLCACGSDPDTKTDFVAKDPRPNTQQPVEETFCRGRPLLTFCEDFDSSNYPGSLLAAPGAMNGTFEFVQDALAPTRPSVLRVRGTSAWLRTKAIPQGGRVNALLMVRLASAVPHAFAAFVFSGGLRVTLGVSAEGKLTMTEDSAKGPFVTVAEPLVATQDWVSVRWDLRSEDNQVFARLRVDDSPIFERKPLASAKSLEGQAALEIGVSASSSIELRFDTVTFAAGD
jgi:hypothetical protein